MENVLYNPSSKQLKFLRNLLVHHTCRKTGMASMAVLFGIGNGNFKKYRKYFIHYIDILHRLILLYRPMSPHKYLNTKYLNISVSLCKIENL